MQKSKRDFLKAAMAVSTAMVCLYPVFASDGRIHKVRITGFKFVPATLSVKPGDTITFTNEDISPHTATATDESWDTGELGQNEKAEIIVSENMTTDYFCRFHPVMKAKLLKE